MVNITYAFKSQTAAATAYSMIKKYLNSKGWEGDWVDMSCPYGITQRSPTHKEIMPYPDGHTYRAPYIQMGGINATDQFKYQVSIRALTHISQEEYNEVRDTFDRIITECNDGELKLDTNNDDAKTMYIWLELHRHQEQLNRRAYRIHSAPEDGEPQFRQGSSSIVFDGYKSVKLYTDY